MAEYLYRAKITHTEKTVEQLYKMQYYVYEKPRMILRALIGFGLVVAAVLSSLPTWGKAILLLIGAWLLVSRDFPAAVRADKALNERRAKLPNMSYGFAPTRAGRPSRCRSISPPSPCSCVAAPFSAPWRTSSAFSRTQSGSSTCSSPPRTT